MNINKLIIRKETDSTDRYNDRNPTMIFMGSKKKNQNIFGCYYGNNTMDVQIGVRQRNKEATAYQI